MYKAPTKAVITDAGFASRFLPITKTVPKAMIPMGPKPIMQYVVEECVVAGIRDIIIIATEDGKAVYEDYFHNAVENVEALLNKQGKADRFTPVRDLLGLANITVIVQDPDLPYGNGSPIKSAQPYLNEDEAFIALYSDDVIMGASDVKTLVQAYAKNPDAKAIITSQEMPESEWKRYGMIALKDTEKKTLSHIVEKPKTPKDSPSALTSYGRYLLTPDVFKHLIPKNIGLDYELWTVDAITKLAEEGDVLVVPSEGKWLTTGDPRNYIMAQIQYVLDSEDYADDIREMLK
jgi:UTP--glucose-1-phosphate uridylyltransferase